MFCKMVGIDCLINFSHHPWKTGIIISTVQIKRQSSERLMQRGLNHTAGHTVVVVWILRPCLFPYTLLAPWNACCVNDLHREQHCCSGNDPCLLGNVPCFAECLASGLLSHCCLARNGSSAGLFRRTRTKDPIICGPISFPTGLWALQRQWPCSMHFVPFECLIHARRHLMNISWMVTE